MCCRFGDILDCAQLRRQTGICLGRVILLRRLSILRGLRIVRLLRLTSISDLDLETDTGHHMLIEQVITGRVRCLNTLRRIDRIDVVGVERQCIHRAFLDFDFCQ